MKDNLRIYGVKDSYIKYLSQYQEHLFRHEGGSSGRKYIGVVFEINKFSYFVPKGQLVELNINSEKDTHYNLHFQAENREINKQKSRIRKNAEIVYNHKKRNGNLTPLAKRTNDFEMLEKLSRDFL